MKELTRDNITKNQVNTINQYKVLQYLKKNLNIYSFKVYLYDKDTIKLIDSNYQSGYFKYITEKKVVEFSDNAPKAFEKFFER